MKISELLTTSVFDAQKAVAEAATSLSLNGKQVDYSSLEVEGVDPRDYPNFSDAYFSYAEYSDGTPLSDAELDDLAGAHSGVLHKMAYDSLTESADDKIFTVVYYSKQTDRNVTKQIRAKTESEVWDSLKKKGLDIVSVEEKQRMAEGSYKAYEPKHVAWVVRHGDGHVTRFKPNEDDKAKAKYGEVKGNRGASIYAVDQHDQSIRMDSLKAMRKKQDVAGGSLKEDEYDKYENGQMGQEEAVAAMFTRLAKQGRDPLDMIAHRFGWSTYELDDLAQQQGFENSAEWLNSFKQGVAEGKQSLAEWEAEMKAKGYTVTKDNKTATYHAWDGTTHKSSYRAGVTEGSIPFIAELMKDKL